MAAAKTAAIFYLKKPIEKSKMIILLSSLEQ
jgi:hypothetical protein